MASNILKYVPPCIILYGSKLSPASHWDAWSQRVCVTVYTLLPTTAYCRIPGANLLPHRSSLNGGINGCKRQSMELLYTVQARVSCIPNDLHRAVLETFQCIKILLCELQTQTIGRASAGFYTKVVFYFGWKGSEHSHLHYDTVHSGRQGPAFRINKVLPSAGMEVWYLGNKGSEEHSLHCQDFKLLLSRRLKQQTELLCSAIRSVFITTKIMSINKHD